MKAPADKTAKRVSAQEWFARHASLALLQRRDAPCDAMHPPADRIAVRT